MNPTPHWWNTSPPTLPPLKAVQSVLCSSPNSEQTAAVIRQPPSPQTQGQSRCCSASSTHTPSPSHGLGRCPCYSTTSFWCGEKKGEFSDLRLSKTCVHSSSVGPKSRSNVKTTELVTAMSYLVHEGRVLTIWDLKPTATVLEQTWLLYPILTFFF